jgi:thiamine monophosphate synthase
VAAQPLPVLALGGVGPDEFAAIRDCGAWGAAGIRAFCSAEAAARFVERAAA